MEEILDRPPLQSGNEIASTIASLKERLRVVRHRILRNRLQSQGMLLQPNPHKALIFAPHSDDETLGCGGFIALKRKLNAPVEVVILTDGSACFGPLSAATAATLVNCRERETERAMEVLGVSKSQVHFLKQPDGQLSSLTKRDRVQLLAQIIELLERYRPQEVLVPHRWDRTPDHEATFDLVHLALQATSLRPLVLQYPIWRFWDGALLDVKLPSDLHSEGIYRVEISQVLEQKRKAFTCYESQFSTFPECSYKSPLPARFQRAFELRYEIFFSLR